MKRLVDVVIVTHNTRDSVLACVESVVAAESLDKCVVVDNGSTDKTAEALRALTPNVVVIRNKQNEGFAKSCNRGAEAGSAPYILFLNSDVVAHERAIDRLVGFLDHHPTHVVAAGALLDARTQRPQVGFAVRAYPTLAAQLALLAGLERYWPTNPISRKQLMLDFDYGSTQDLAAQPAGACMACRRPAFETERGFDERYEFWFEDVDLLARLRARGRVAYVHDALFDHIGGLTVNARPKRSLLVARYVGLLRYFKKHRPRREYQTMRVVVAAVAGARGLGALPVDRKVAEAYCSAAVGALRGP
jgi:N-acetylglucosaminyl-diphospho-decaprenol L-rhamnosyltransferase